MQWVLTDDVETQRKGLVGVLWSPPQIFSKQQQLNLRPRSRDHIKGPRLYNGVPGRVAAIHVCLPDEPIFNLIWAVLAVYLGGKERNRFIRHTGEGVEVQYRLHGYGIPVDLLPITETGNIKTKNHQQWLKVRRMIERESSSTANSISNDEPTAIYNVVECPGLNDVIFRVGDSYLHHPGNVFFRGLIESRFDEYNSSGRNDKAAIILSLVDTILSRNGRFLIWDAQWWTVLHEREKMRSKVAGAFKDQRRRLKAAANVQVNESSTYKFEGLDGRNTKRMKRTFLADDEGDDSNTARNSPSCFCSL
jgi:hypothetical protein